MFGVHSAMPLRTAGALCPQGVFVPVDGRKYQAVSREVMAILRRFTPLVEPISIDEAFLDVTGSQALFGDGETIARPIKAAIRDEVGLTASVGVGDDEARRQDRVGPAQAGRARRRAAGRRGGVPGAAADLAAVGRRAARRPRRCATSGSSRSATSPRSPPTCSSAGSASTAASLVDRARRPRPGSRSATGDPAKSVSHEHTFDVDTADREVIERTLLGMADGVAWRLRASRPQGGHGRRSRCATRRSPRSRARSGSTVPTDLTEPIYEAAVDAAPARAARAADPPGRRDGVELPRPRAARAVRRRGPAPATRRPRRSTGSGASTANASITRATARAGRACPRRSSGTRCRPRRSGRTWPARRRGADVAGRVLRRRRPRTTGPTTTSIRPMTVTA